MNNVRTEVQPLPSVGYTYPVTYPAAGRVLADSVLTVARTMLIGTAVAVVLLGAAMTIAYVVTAMLGLTGYDPSLHY